MTLEGGGERRGAGMRTICDVCESAPAVLFCAADEAALCRPCDEKVIPASSYQWSSASPFSQIGVNRCSIGAEVEHGAMVGLIGRLAAEISGIYYLTASSRGGYHPNVTISDVSSMSRCSQLNLVCLGVAFFHCEIDGTSLCLSCDMTVHVGGKRTHGRYLLLRQSVEFPGDKLAHMDDVAMQSKELETQIDQKKPPHSVTKEQMANHHNGSDDPAPDGNCDDQGNINSKMIDLNMQPVRTNGQGSNSQVCHMLPTVEVLYL
nr:unnamed protein product [Digitaria exilis]